MGKDFMNRIISLGATCAILLSTHSALQAQDSSKDAKAKKRAAAFERMDTNSDGSLSKDEFMTTKGAKENPEAAGKNFASMDKDGNGSLSKEEFTKAPGGGKKAEGKKGKEGKKSETSEEAGE